MHDEDGNADWVSGTGVILGEEVQFGEECCLTRRMCGLLVVLGMSGSAPC